MHVCLVDLERRADTYWTQNLHKACPHLVVRQQRSIPSVSHTRLLAACSLILATIRMCVGHPPDSAFHLPMPTSVHHQEREPVMIPQLRVHCFRNAKTDILDILGISDSYSVVARHDQLSLRGQGASGGGGGGGRGGEVCYQRYSQLGQGICPLVAHTAQHCLVPRSRDLQV